MIYSLSKSMSNFLAKAAGIPASGPGLRLALFPQEWYRDINSAWLRTLPSDAPWLDANLLSAMLKLPFQSDSEERL